MTIKIVSAGGRPFDGPVAVFDDRGGTIGRRVDCTLVIPDKERHVSRIHAVIACTPQGFILHDQGSFLPVRVNGMRVGYGLEAPICEGDELQIGPFGMRVQEMETAWDIAMRGSNPFDRAVAARAAQSPAPRRAREPSLTEAAHSFTITDLGGEGATPVDIVLDAGSEPALQPVAPEPAPSGPEAKPRSPSRKGRRADKTIPPVVEVVHPGMEGAAAAPAEPPPVRAEPSIAPAPKAAIGTPPEAGPAAADEKPARKSRRAKAPNSTFELLARRLEAKTDQAYEPFMPAVWEEGGTAPAALIPAAPASPVQEAPPAAMPDGNADVSNVASFPATASAPAADFATGPAERFGHLLAAAAGERGPEPGETSSATEQAVEVPDSGGRNEIPDPSPAATVALSGEDAVAAGAENGPVDGHSEARVTASPATSDEEAGIEADEPPSEPAESLGSVVRRRRQRGAHSVLEVWRDASAAAPDVSAAPQADQPEIVLVLQRVAPAAGSDAASGDEYLIPIRRRNRRGSAGPSAETAGRSPEFAA
ncbi:MAG: FHA domain-containing protein [Betaproteobacteria bacterium]|nr:FHA domain-containing protein [Betaproteobacteria bacterium]